MYLRIRWLLAENVEFPSWYQVFRDLIEKRHKSFPYDDKSVPLFKIVLKGLPSVDLSLEEIKNEKRDHLALHQFSNNQNEKEVLLPVLFREEFHKNVTYRSLP